MISPKFHLKFQTCFFNGNADVEDVVSEIDNVEGEVVGFLHDIGRKYVKIPSILVTQEFLVENGVRNMAELVDALPELTLSDFMQVCWIDGIVDVDDNGGGEHDNNHDAAENDSEDNTANSSPVETSSTAKDVAQPMIVFISSLILVLSSTLAL